MGQRLVIDIIKNRKVIGNCYYHWEGYTLCALERAKNIIDNYNKYLTHITDETELSLRLFQEQNVDASIKKPCAVVEANSEEFLKDAYPMLDICGVGDADATVGRIGISNADMENNRDNGEGFIVIDLDNKRIELDKLFVEYDIDEYCELYEIEKTNLNLTTCPSNLNLWLINFNEICDAIEFINKNICGWIDENFDNMIFVPID